jgi:hypothetical protein
MIPIFLCILLLTACTGPQTPADPLSLEVEYGESGITPLCETAVDPEDVPFLVAARPSEIHLRFGSRPDSFTVHYATDADGYETFTEAVIPGTVLPAPTDDASYLFRITASWENSDEQTFWFRFLPENGSSPQASPLLIPQLKPSDLFGIVVASNVHQAEKTCRSTSEIQTVLDFLQENLSTDFVRAKVPSLETDYVLRLALTDGSQLTLGYIPGGQDAWILLGGIPYEAVPMDLESLWNALQTEAVPFSTLPEGDFLQITEEYPDEDWGDTIRYGHVTALADTVTFDEILWHNDADSPNGFRLEAGQAAVVLPLSETCQFWYLADHSGPCCQVTQTDFFVWLENSQDMLLRLYIKDGVVTAICEQFLP